MRSERDANEALATSSWFEEEAARENLQRARERSTNISAVCYSIVFTVLGALTLWHIAARLGVNL